MPDLDAESLARRLTTRSPAGIAEQIHQLIAEGTLPPGSRLPTVRDIAQELGVSVGTIAQAWGILRAEQAVQTRRRGGTRVVDSRSGSGAEFTGFSGIDMLLASPDRSLLPDAESSLVAALKHRSLNAWSREAATELLAQAVRTDVPFPAEEVLAVSGTTEALRLGLHTAVEPGGQLAVEAPASPGLLELARDLGLELIQVDTDDDGPLVASLQQALARGAAAFAYCPEGAFSRHHTLSAERAEKLAGVLAETEAAVVEDDVLGPLAEDRSANLGALLPERTLRAVSYPRAFGVDTSCAALVGPTSLVERASGLRAGGMGMVSRLLQQTLVGHLGSTAARRQVTFARRAYRQRRHGLTEALQQVELAATSGPQSWSVWVPVQDEQQAALALSAEGVVVGLGSASYVVPPAQQYLRIAVAQLPEETARLAELATMVKKAADGELRPSFV